MSWLSFKDRYAAPFHALELEKLSSDLDRAWAIIDAVQDSLLEICLPESSPGKSCAVFSEWKDKGNSLLAAGKVREAGEAYSRALFFAPGDDEAALALGNRSAALLQLGLARDSLADIEASLQVGFPPAKRFRLLNRRGECRLMLGEVAAAAESFRSALDQLETGNCDLTAKQAAAWRQRIADHLRSCDGTSVAPQSALRELRCVRPAAPVPAGGPNPKMPSASCAVEVRCSSTDGRGLYASRAIGIGEVLVVERPYAACVIEERFVSHCYRCANRSRRLLPCRACPHVGFCGPQCEAEAWSSFHRFECPVMGLLAQLPNRKMVRLAFRTLVATDFAEVRRVVGEASTAWSGGEADADFESLFADKFESADYLAAFSIVGNSRWRSNCDLTDRALMAVFLALCAAKAGYVESPLESSDAAIVIAALLRHLQSLPCNAHEISEETVPADGNLSAAGLEEIASGLFPVLSLVNHSCDPNVHRVCYEGDVCTLRSLRTLVAGEQLLDCYSQHFAVGPRLERRAALREQYFFECRCPACEADWPQYEDLCDIVYPTTRLPQLSPRDAKMWEKFSKNLESVMTLLGKGRAAFENEESEKFFVKFQTFLCRLVERPWKELNNNEECLKVLWNLKGNCFQDFP